MYNVFALIDDIYYLLIYQSHEEQICKIRWIICRTTFSADIWLQKKHRQRRRR